jgi:hypothetical protein
LPEDKLPVRVSFDLKPFFVDRAVMTPTQHREIRQLRRATVCPMLDVMALSKRPAAAREATAFVAMLKRAP